MAAAAAGGGAPVVEYLIVRVLSIRGLLSSPQQVQQQQVSQPTTATTSPSVPTPLLQTQPRSASSRSNKGSIFAAGESATVATASVAGAGGEEAAAEGSVKCKLVVAVSDNAAWEEKTNLVPISTSGVAVCNEEIVFPKITRLETTQQEVLEISLKQIRNPNSRLFRSSTKLGTCFIRIADVASRGSEDTSAWFPVVNLGAATSTVEIKLSVFWFRGSVEDSEELTLDISSRTKVVRQVKVDGFLSRLAWRKSDRSSASSLSRKDDSLNTELKNADEALQADTVIMEPDDSWKGVLSGLGIRGFLSVSLYEARGLLAADTGGKSDPYAIITCKGQQMTSKIVRSTLMPVWNESFVFGEKSELETDDQVHIIIKDWDLLKRHDDLGELTLSMSELTSDAALWYKLEPTNLMHTGNTDLGWVKLSLKYTPPATPKVVLPSLQDEQSLQIYSSPSLPKLPAEENRSTPVGSPSTKSVSLIGVRPIVSVRLLQARNLLPADSNGKSDPYCIVHICSESKRTSVRRRTLNPQWNEAFTFGMREYIHEFDSIEFLVFDKDVGIGDIRDDKIGSLTLPLNIFSGSVAKPTWFALESPINPYAGEIQVQVEYKGFSNLADCRTPLLAPEIPKMPTLGAAISPLTRQASQPSQQPTQASQKKDIYKGKIWLYELQVTVISARGLMASDYATRSSDPYCVLKCGAEKWRTKTVRKSLNPVWNERFRFRHPEGLGRAGLGTTDRLKIHVFDWDAHSADDPLGQVNIGMAYIIDKLGYIDIKGKSFSSWFPLDPPEGMSADDEDGENLATNSRFKMAVEALNKAGKGVRHRAKRTALLGSGDVNGDTTSGDTPDSSAPASYGEIRLTLKLIPIGETRLMKKTNLLVKLDCVNQLCCPNLSPVPHTAQTMENDAFFNIFPSSVYAKVLVGVQTKDTVAVPIRFGVGGSPQFNTALLFSDDIDWMLAAWKSHTKAASKRRALTRSRSGVDDAEENPDPFKVSICSGQTDEVIAEFRGSLHALAERKESPQFTLAEAESEIPLTFSSSITSGVAKYPNLTLSSPVLKASFHFLETKEELVPILGNIFVRIVSAKFNWHSFMHSVRVVVRYGEKIFVTKVISGDPNPVFEIGSSSTRFSVTNMHTTAVVEVWRINTRKSKFSRLAHLIGAAEEGDAKDAGGDEDADDSKQENEPEVSSKWGSLYASCSFSVYDLIEQEAKIVFSEESLTSTPMHTPFKLHIKDRQGKVKGSVWLSARFVENEAGILSPNPKPTLRPGPPFTLANFRHELNRTLSIFGWIQHVAAFRHHVLDWENPALSFTIFTALMFFCVIDYYATHFMAIIPLCFIIYMIRTHIQRQDGTFADFYGTRTDTEQSFSAVLKMSVLAAEDLLVTPSFEDNYGNPCTSNICAFVSIKKSLAIRSESTIGWTRTVSGERNPVFATAKAGYGVKSGGSERTTLISWTPSNHGYSSGKTRTGSPRSRSRSPGRRNSTVESRLLSFGDDAMELLHTEIPAFELRIKNHLLLNPLLSVIVHRVRGLDVYSDDPSAQALGAFVEVRVKNGGESFRTKHGRNKLSSTEWMWDERFVFGDSKAVGNEDIFEILVHAEGAEGKVEIVGTTSIKLSDLESIFGMDENDVDDRGHDDVLGDDDGGVVNDVKACWMKLYLPEKKRKWRTGAGVQNSLSPMVSITSPKDAMALLMSGSSPAPTQDQQQPQQQQQPMPQYLDQVGEILLSMSWLADTGLFLARSDQRSKKTVETDLTRSEREPSVAHETPEADPNNTEHVKHEEEQREEESEEEEEEENTVAPDSWKRNGTIAVVDLFNFENDRKVFLGRAMLPLSSLVQDEEVREQPKLDQWIELGKKLDGSRHDRRLEAEAEKFGTRSLGRVLISAELKLPDPQAKEKQLDLQEARRADKGNAIQKFKLINSRLESAQNFLYSVNNQAERFKNLFNWSHPTRTKHIFKLFVMMFIFFAIVPSRFVFLIGFVGEFTEHFRPLGTMSLKYKHMLALLPTDDDIRNSVTGEVANAKRRTKKMKAEKLENKTQVLESLKRYVRYSKPQESSQEAPQESELPIKRKRSRSLSKNGSSQRYRAPAGAIQSLKSFAKQSTLGPQRLHMDVSLGDGLLIGKLFIFHVGSTSANAETSSSISSFLTRHRFIPRFCAATQLGIHYWTDRAQAEISAPHGHILAIRKVEHPIDEAIRIRYASHCGNPASLFYVETGPTPGHSHGDSYILAATSSEKAAFWVSVVRASCLLEVI